MHLGKFKKFNFVLKEDVFHQDKPQNLSPFWMTIHFTYINFKFIFLSEDDTLQQDKLQKLILVLNDDTIDLGKLKKKKLY